MSRVLIIDDEKEICESLKMILEYEGYTVDYSTDPQEGIDKLGTEPFDVLLLDIQMPGKSGFEILKWITGKKLILSVIIISAHGNVENAIKATKLGAFDFIEKPIDRDKLLISIRNALKTSNLIKENEQLRKDLQSETQILGESKAIKDILATIERVAPTDARILITGDNGTGKELVAREIHKRSNRADKPFIEVNCAAIPNELIESELFGHEKGAFTGAQQKRIGKFELANGGTLFLDEVGDMSLQAQAKVLRAIENNVIERVGGNSKISVDVRIISATNKNLQKEIENGNFREDLFHRLNVIPVYIPPLRERKEDIPLLANFFMKQICLKNNFPGKEIEREALEFLKTLPWHGNVRELRNFIERLVIMVPGKKLSLADVKKYAPISDQHNDDLLSVTNSFQEFKEKAEKTFILKQLEAHNWNISKTAEALDIQRSHLYNKMKKYGIEKEN